MYDYRDDEVYKVMEALVKNAGIRIKYKDLSEDIQAHTRDNIIEMPADPEAFPDDGATASMVLGHELGHLLSDLDSDIDPMKRARNEAVCDLIGVYLTRLAEMIYENKSNPAQNTSKPEELNYIINLQDSSISEKKIQVKIIRE